MPRGPFDTTCDFIYGPSGLSPGSVWNTCDCRVVPLRTEIPSIYPLLFVTAYITVPGPAPNSPSVIASPPTFTIDTDAADRIAVPSGGSANWQVVWTETVSWRSRLPYYRARVQPIGVVGTISFPSSGGSTTFTVPVGATLLYAEINGQGGFGGLGTGNGGGGGGGGGYAYALHSVSGGDVIVIDPIAASIMLPSGATLIGGKGGDANFQIGATGGISSVSGTGWLNVVLHNGGSGGNGGLAGSGGGGGGSGGPIGNGKNGTIAFSPLGGIGGKSGGLPGGYGGSGNQIGFDLGGGGGGQPFPGGLATPGGLGLVKLSWA